VKIFTPSIADHAQGDGLPLRSKSSCMAGGRRTARKSAKAPATSLTRIAVIDEWGLDAFRFYVLRELDIGPDGNWTDAGFKSRYNAELANGLGNLVNRSLSMLKRYRNGVVPPKDDELAAVLRRPRTKRAHCSNKTSSSPRCKASGDLSRAPTNTWTTPRRSSWPRTRHSQTAGRSALQSDGNLPGAGGFALAISAWNGGENLRATRFDRHTGQTRRRDLGRFARWSENRRTRALVSAKGCVILRRVTGGARLCARSISRSMSMCQEILNAFRRTVC